MQERSRLLLVSLILLTAATASAHHALATSSTTEDTKETHSGRLFPLWKASTNISTISVEREVLNVRVAADGPLVATLVDPTGQERDSIKVGAGVSGNVSAIGIPAGQWQINLNTAHGVMQRAFATEVRYEIEVEHEVWAETLYWAGTGPPNLTFEAGEGSSGFGRFEILLGSLSPPAAAHPESSIRAFTIQTDRGSLDVMQFSRGYGKVHEELIWHSDAGGESVSTKELVTPLASNSFYTGWRSAGANLSVNFGAVGSSSQPYKIWFAYKGQAGEAPSLADHAVGLFCDITCGEGTAGTVVGPYGRMEGGHLTLNIDNRSTALLAVDGRSPAHRQSPTEYTVTRGDGVVERVVDQDRRWWGHDHPGQWNISLVHHDGLSEPRHRVAVGIFPWA